MPTQLDFPALDPTTADNISNYKLFNLGPNRTQDALSVDESSFIQAANFVSTTSSARRPGDPYTGRIDLTFAPGLPSGLYALYALGFNPATGNRAITDAAGNPLDADLSTPGLQNYYTLIDLQPQRGVHHRLPVGQQRRQRHGRHQRPEGVLRGPRPRHGRPRRRRPPRTSTSTSRPR